MGLVNFFVAEQQKANCLSEREALVVGSHTSLPAVASALANRLRRSQGFRTAVVASIGADIERSKCRLPATATAKRLAEASWAQLVVATL